MPIRTPTLCIYIYTDSDRMSVYVPIIGREKEEDWKSVGFRFCDGGSFVEIQ
jgi:hypothetical protein